MPQPTHHSPVGKPTERLSKYRSDCLLPTLFFSHFANHVAPPPKT
jgi:hypothetical protein